jgi:monoamine oxidase
MNRGPVVIIGGGIAGLATALELARNHIPTIVLEAKDRFGGRIHTIRHSGVPIELGAEFVHGRNQPLLRAIRSAQLSTRPVPDINRIFENGKFHDTKIRDIVADIFNHIDPHKPDCTIEAFLSGQRFKESTRRLVKHFVTGFDAAHTDRISAHACLRAEYAAEQMSLEKQLRVTEGYSALVKYFTEEIQAHGGRLITGAKVRRIHWEKGTVEVMAARENSNEMFRAQIAVVTLPVGVLKTNDVIFDPPLPEKIEAAKELEFGNVVKLVFQFAEMSWHDFGFIHIPDAPIPTWWSDPRGPILTGWAGGTKADALLKYSAEALCDTGLGILAKIVFDGMPLPVLRERLLSVHYHNWADDPDIRGAYSYIPVNGLDLPKRLGAPVSETLFFAGEATVTDAQTGTVFGALETGLRVAREILGR